MTFIFILIFYHLSADGRALKPPTILTTNSSVKACAMKKGHGNVEVWRMYGLDDGQMAPGFQPAILVCPGDER